MTCLQLPTALEDPFVALPLHGLRLIEASAGTGKTFTLATLVTRLVIERGLRVGEILAVTFTEAATQELRERLRQRLDLAARVMAGDPALDADAAAVQLTRELVARQLAHEDAGALGRRLRRAAHEVDLAAVFTIHGFCARALAEHALDTGQAFVAPALVGSDIELREEVAADLWRALGTDARDAEALEALWPGGPESLARDLTTLLRAPRLLPPAEAAAADPRPALEAAAQAVREAFATHGDTLRAQLEAAIAGKALNANSYKPDLVADLWPSLHAWCAQADATVALHPRLDRLTPATLAARTNKGREAARPASPLCEAVATLLDAVAAHDRWRAAHRIALLHRVRDQAAARLAKLKRVRRVQTFDDLIDDLAAALDGPHGATLARRLRAQYAFALVDEFQDTDARQWGIFDRIFGRGADAPALFVIGDPKQAIYRFRGGDVHTYLAARAHAEPAPALRHNFRSRPSVLRAVAALYAQAGDSAFVDPRIGFVPVDAGGRVHDQDFLRHGVAAPALTVRWLPPPEQRDAWKAPESRELATRACAAAIHALLADAQAGVAQLRDGNDPDGAPRHRAVRPGDIAVLVRKHHEATRIRAALAAAGIAAVTAGRQSLFETGEAGELLTLFDALLQPGDDARLRAALATVLIGLDAAAIDALDRDGEALHAWQLRAMDWRERWQRHGPLALVSDLCAEHAPRLLGLLDGERRLTNLLQLGEELQQADARALGSQGLVDWLRHRIAEADPDDETQQLRLESDADCVQVLTLHKSKGLEFPLVFLPFAGIGTAPDKPRWTEVADGDARALQLLPDAAAIGEAQQQERAEDARLLYVGLTRARHALWLAAGPLYQAERAPLARLLGDAASLRARDGDAFAIDADPALPPARLPPLPRPPAALAPPPRAVQRPLHRDWWIYSFTQLANEDAGQAPAADATAEEGGARDEREPLLPGETRFAGSRFGNALHGALEQVDFAAWRDWRGEEAPPGVDAMLRAALRAEGYVDADLDEGSALLAQLVGHTLATRLPEGARLCALPPEARRAEMEFHFALQPTAIDALLRTLHAHDVLRGRQAFGLRRQLEGLMTGKIDLVYAHEGRYYVLDYKSNRLPAYDAATLDRAMDDSEYVLQALIYTVALHRWLRFRLGDGYDYARDFGGVRYLFCRGLDAFAATAPAPGVVAWQPEPALVHALDALFAGAAA